MDDNQSREVIRLLATILNALQKIELNTNETGMPGLQGEDGGEG